MTGLVLMYHRVCAQAPETTCYFTRGTAVEPEVVAAQVAWISDRLPLIALDDLVAGAVGVALTFDDGYRDVLSVAARWPVAVFPVAGHLAAAPRPMFIDAYYGLLHTAGRPAAPRLAPVWAALDRPDQPAPAFETDPRWWVRGPLKEALQAASPAACWAALGALAEAVEGQLPAPRDLYLSAPELQGLLEQGHLVGGHGVSHRRLTGLSTRELEAELEGSAQLLRSLGAAPTHFCYPDGAANPTVCAAVAAAGWAHGWGVQAGATQADSDHLLRPRCLARNAYPGTPGFQPIEQAVRALEAA